MRGARYKSERLCHGARHLILKSPHSLAELFSLALLLLDHYMPAPSAVAVAVTHNHLVMP